ncbi:Asp-tRNA(Asn)/Glu-tRNA(Gln) amidotransferase subunit GatA [Catellicoccus marimammalium]|uniref:Glutamyl-tRNA(Gln) amidotransferase subunit A n=2 Tax=Catellicoccus TaxID=300418 RepID=K8Z8Q5_9ENTE|nr:Aspartyl-tRNA(Asn) amidotransferase subunit A / Glutamyl-tRNA(Gln) amidotransferase subunit A [Catellicoccus marimammalium M35/04/3]
MNVLNSSLLQLHEMLVNKEITSEQLVKAYIERIEATDETMRSFLTLNKEQALEQARKIDEEGIKEEEYLKGIPVGIKDNIVTKDLRTTAASKMLENFVPVYDATVMEKLYQAGMIPVGKLNMDEFAMGASTETSHFQQTVNAWDHTKVPGGSSGGSATAVAARQIPCALGSDTGGSVRQPSSFNGVVGMKPTYGRVSRYGLIAFASSLDQIGTITKTVEDNALLLNAICGPDEKDYTSARVEVPDFTAKIGQNIAGMKIGVPKEFMSDAVSTEVKEKVQEAMKQFEALGATVEEVSLPYAPYGISVYYVQACAEAASNLSRFDGIRYGYRVENVENLEDVYVKSRSEGFGDEVKRRIMIGTYSLSAGNFDAHYKKASQVRTLICEDFAKVLKEYDVILAPTSPTPAFTIGEVQDPVAMYTSDLLTIPVNLAGLPSMSIPCGFVDGLPVGMQIIGRPFDEATIYQVASAFEKATDFHLEKPEIAKGEDHE